MITVLWSLFGFVSALILYQRGYTKGARDMYKQIVETNEALKKFKKNIQEGKEE